MAKHRFTLYGTVEDTDGTPETIAAYQAGIAALNALTTGTVSWAFRANRYDPTGNNSDTETKAWQSSTEEPGGNKLGTHIPPLER